MHPIKKRIHNWEYILSDILNLRRESRRENAEMQKYKYTSKIDKLKVEIGKWEVEK